ncbi:zf-DHHC-domain-containing protein [Thozetella sp. PMI_491]|nr:zf-DHHC-domain-containing protein [Thozetella sp. PMI_491]
MVGIQTGPSARGLQILAVPAVCVLISFLAYYSQYLFATSENLLPGPLSRSESILFNVLLVCLWWTYYRACAVDPGRYTFPATSPTHPSVLAPATNPATGVPGVRWCKKCRAPKPLRAHHCRHCGRCIPRMDHHCPWTSNCVSLQSFPYFLRFLVYTNVCLWMLAYHLSVRIRAIWAERHLPAYLGPTLGELSGLTVLTLTCAATILALSILLYTTTRSWMLNMTMIEGWEVERHEAVLERYESEDADFWGLDGAEVILERIEFPYDLGVLANMAQAMGTRNPLAWFFPFAGGPVIGAGGKGAGWEWEENGFNNRHGMWPPPDPEKLRRVQNGWPGAASRRVADGRPAYDELEGEDARAAFARRQRADLLRRQAQRADLMAELEEVDGLYDIEDDTEDAYYEEGLDGEPGWTNSDGDRLRDYGVDEEVEDEELIPLDADDDVPLSELMRRRKNVTSNGGRED